MIWRPLRSTLFPYTTLFRSGRNGLDIRDGGGERPLVCSQEISEGAEQVRELIATEGLGDVFNAAGDIDRKSTRLNSSHEWISYAVFCLKKKKKKNEKYY